MSKKYLFKIISIISFLTLLFVWEPAINNAQAVGLYVPIACNAQGAACAAESTLTGFAGNWSANYGGGASIISDALPALMKAADISPETITGITSAIQEWLSKLGGNFLGRSMIPAFMSTIINSSVQDTLGTGGDNKAGNIVQNWLDYTSNARIGGGQNFTQTYYDDPNVLNLPQPMQETLKNDLESRYGKYGTNEGIKYDDLAKYNYDEQNKSGTDVPSLMSDSSDLLLLLQPQNNYMGQYLMASDYQDLTSSRITEAALNEPLSNSGYLNTKDKNGNVIPGSLSKDVYQQQIVQMINAAQNIQSLADAEGFIEQIFSSKINDYLGQKFNEKIGEDFNSTLGHVFGN
jgi:hypothetical protein